MEERKIAKKFIIVVVILNKTMYNKNIELSVFNKGGFCMSKTIITISRQYGSGGREIGEKLANTLGIPFYDNKLLEVAAKESGIGKELFEANDEKNPGSLLYILGMQYSDDMLPFNHKLFLAQFSAIKKIASEGPCVIVGRCADYALKDFNNVLNVFIHADIEKRIERISKELNIPDKKANEVIIRVDKQRMSYYNFYTSQKWGRAENYHLCLDSMALGIDGTVELLKKFVELLEVRD
ncbi:MAG: Cytidylate kinase [Oscillospiraceae bacterium]|nr:Cytidylate kinase [Oscillospiraceae bacterium]